MMGSVMLLPIMGSIVAARLTFRHGLVMLARVGIVVGVIRVPMIAVAPGALAGMLVEVLHTKETECSWESYSLKCNGLSARQTSPYHAMGREGPRVQRPERRSEYEA